MSVLYLSYDGMLEPLGQSQVLAYLERLAVGRRIHLISFEKAQDWADADRRERIAERIHAAGIHWHPRRYHKRWSALATAWDIMVGTSTALWLTVRYRLRLLHARSDVAALMAWIVKGLTGAKFVFDMRGFWADERVDGGLWPRDGRLYRIAKWFESRFLLSADHVVSLTQAAVRVMEGFPWLQGHMPPISVIPTCADLERFRPMHVPSIENIRQPRFVLGHVGSAGTWQLFDEVATCFSGLLAVHPEAMLLIVNRSEHAYIRERLAAAGVLAEQFELLAVEHDEVPAQMARMTAGVFFNTPTFSRQASAPTKLAEFLGCGIPCLSNSGYGDVSDILESEGVGVAVAGFDTETMRAGLQRLIALSSQSDIASRCIAAANKHFSLEMGVARYEAIYRKLVAN
jgi:glycosyltransferase involved in cell wall biosynthesis